MVRARQLVLAPPSRRPCWLPAARSSTLPADWRSFSADKPAERSARPPAPLAGSACCAVGCLGWLAGWLAGSLAPLAPARRALSRPSQSGGATGRRAPGAGCPENRILAQTSCRVWASESCGLHRQLGGRLKRSNEIWIWAAKMEEEAASSKTSGAGPEAARANIDSFVGLAAPLVPPAQFAGQGGASKCKRDWQSDKVCARSRWRSLAADCTSAGRAHRPGAAQLAAEDAHAKTEIKWEPERGAEIPTATEINIATLELLPNGCTCLPARLYCGGGGAELASCERIRLATNHTNGTTSDNTNKDEPSARHWRWLLGARRNGRCCRCRCRCRRCERVGQITQPNCRPANNALDCADRWLVRQLAVCATSGGGGGSGGPLDGSSCSNPRDRNYGSKTLFSLEDAPAASTTRAATCFQQLNSSSNSDRNQNASPEPQTSASPTSDLGEASSSYAASLPSLSSSSLSWFAEPRKQSSASLSSLSAAVSLCSALADVARPLHLHQGQQAGSAAKPASREDRVDRRPSSCTSGAPQQQQQQRQQPRASGPAQAFPLQSLSQNSKPDETSEQVKDQQQQQQQQQVASQLPAEEVMASLRQFSLQEETLPTPNVYPNNTLIADLNKCHSNIATLWPQCNGFSLSACWRSVLRPSNQRRKHRSRLTFQMPDSLLRTNAKVGQGC